MMEQGQLIANGIVNFGAGIVALVVVFGVVIWLAKKIPPYLKAMSEQAAISNEVIKTNSQFMGEMAKSNQNIAKALELLAPIVDSNITLLKEHDARAQQILAEMMKVSERTIQCLRNGRVGDN